MESNLVKELKRLNFRLIASYPDRAYSKDAQGNSIKSKKIYRKIILYKPDLTQKQPYFFNGQKFTEEDLFLVKKAFADRGVERITQFITSFDNERIKIRYCIKEVI